MKGQQTFWIILISNLFHVFYLFSFYKLAYMKKVKNIPVYTVIALLLNVCLNFYLIPKYGMEGAAIATVTSELFLACMLFIYSKNKAIKFHG
ncbi:hypothetical protein C7Y70_20520 [Pseudoalteromonas sp. KS88]|nr:hypothetical protein C7Y70_20520 [Pseudoalteromonas sp. KS88]